MISCSENVPQFLNLVIKQLEKLTAHSFIAKCHSKRMQENFRECIESSEENEIIILGGFAKNYSFVVQDEVQGLHWNNL